MTVNFKANAVSFSLHAAFVDNIGVSISELFIFDFSRYMISSAF